MLAKCILSPSRGGCAHVTDVDGDGIGAVLVRSWCRTLTKASCGVVVDVW